MTFPDFLPPEVHQLDEPESIALAQAIQRCAIASPQEYGSPIATSFVRQGNGDIPFLLLHGFDSSLLEFRRLLPKLSAMGEAYAVDLLGFGFTNRPLDLSYSPAEIRAHLYQFWQQCLARPVVLMGASMGGAAAMDFALTYPEAVDRLVLLDSAGFTGKPFASQWLFPPLGQLATAFLANPRVRQQIGRNAYHNPALATLDAYYCGALHLKMPSWSQALIRFTRAGGYPLEGDRIAAVEQPTLVLWGESDRILGTDLAQQFASTLPDGKLVWLPACGHVPHLESPDRVAEAIVDFIKG